MTYDEILKTQIMAVQEIAIVIRENSELLMDIEVSFSIGILFL